MKKLLCFSILLTVPFLFSACSLWDFGERDMDEIKIIRQQILGEEMIEENPDFGEEIYWDY